MFIDYIANAVRELGAAQTEAGRLAKDPLRQQPVSPHPAPPLDFGNARLARIMLADAAARITSLQMAVEELNS